MDDHTFKLEVMLCFWYCIHKECLEEAQFLYSQDKIIGKIMKNLRENGESDLAIRRKKIQDRLKRKN